MPTQVMAMEPLFSDHSPLGLIVVDQRDNQKRPFRFYNCLVKHQIFKKGVQAGIWKNLKEVRSEMQKLNTKEFKGVADRVQRIKRDLMHMQNNMRVVTMHQNMIEEEKKLRTKLIKWSQIEESIYKQKSRVQWLKLGDANTAYFFASMKNKKAQNQITMLTKENGTTIRGRSEIKQEVVGLY
ncbi:hypothetical protein R3W88_033809 [Solanum pinnatisectum]|uniref:Uncharacterized protein n=1 Tax=Solanum pinnatisectum TaxID=50273 RepID=A0AAV9K1S5_9SOLN|nr:hypothetical protein R3W88_033809 [Solanum pinnatisectum]